MIGIIGEKTTDGKKGDMKSGMKGGKKDATIDVTKKEEGKLVDLETENLVGTEMAEAGLDLQTVETKTTKDRKTVVRLPGLSS